MQHIPVLNKQPCDFHCKQESFPGPIGLLQLANIFFRFVAFVVVWKSQ